MFNHPNLVENVGELAEFLKICWFAKPQLARTNKYFFAHKLYFNEPILTWKLFVISGSWLYYLCWLLSIFPGHLLHTCTSHWNKNMKNLKPWAWDLVLSKGQKQILKFSSYQCLFYFSFMDTRWCHWLMLNQFWVSLINDVINGSICGIKSYCCWSDHLCVSRFECGGADSIGHHDTEPDSPVQSRAQVMLDTEQNISEKLFENCQREILWRFVWCRRNEQWMNELKFRKSPG